MMKKKCFLTISILIFFASFAVPEEEPQIERAFPPHAILIASYRGDETMVREILAAGADKNTRDSLGATALHTAVLQENPMVIKLLLDYGFDPNAKTANGNTPLHNAVTANNAPGVRLLLQYGADKRAKNEAGITPLEKARKEEKTSLIGLFR